jgi:hypothetical protein
MAAAHGKAWSPAARKAARASGRSVFFLVLRAGMVLLPLAGPLAAQEVAGDDVKRAVRKATTYLKSRQGPDGAWRDAGYRGGMTAVCLLALLNAGADPNDETITRGLAALGRVPNERTYVVSLKAQVYAAAGAQTYRRELNAAAAWLVQAQQSNGMWGYDTGSRRSWSDNSNTQFALLGLHEAAQAGANVPAATWSASRRHFVNNQNLDGGWNYNRRGSPSYGSMTAAAIASLYICGQRLMVGNNHTFIRGAYPGCGRYTQNTALAKGIEWMAKRFSVNQNPGRQTAWVYYYLYALERVGMISGLRTFGRHDWYRQGAAHLVRTQRNDGRWGTLTYDTAFCLLFLAKGNRPVLIQKVQWPGHWNRNLHDLENLTNAIGEKLGKRTTWQSTTLDLPLTELRASPILFIAGHEFPAFTADQKEKLKQFVDRAGGTLLFEACCGKEEFAAGFRALAKDLWPEYRLHPLPKDHPVFRSYHKLEDTYGLEGLDSGCRTGVFFSPNALSCLWELQDIPQHSELAFQLGANLAAYATGRDQLRDKLEIVELPEIDDRPDGERSAEAPRGAVRIARLVHDGDYNADPHAMVHLAGLLRDRANIDVVARSRHLRADSKSLYEYPVLFMTGHYTFRLEAAEIEALRRYLSRGGVLMANACCGKEEFDASFRAMAEALFPDAPLTALPADHPIYTGRTGVALGELRYRPILAQRLSRRGTVRPPLEQVTLDGRTVILYSKFDFCCALEGDRPFSCYGYTDEDGRRLAVAIFLHAIQY